MSPWMVSKAQTPKLSFCPCVFTTAFPITHPKKSFYFLPLKSVESILGDFKALRLLIYLHSLTYQYVPSSSSSSFISSTKKLLPNPKSCEQASEKVNNTLLA